MTNNIVFLCGFPSSGTDLLRAILNAHPDIYIGDEYPFLPGLTQKFSSTVPSDELDSLLEALTEIDIYHHLLAPNLSTSHFDQSPQLPLASVYSQLLTSDEKRWKGNKTPQYTENIDAIRKLFPTAKFIVIARDIRDVALSWQKKWGKDKLLCASKWNSRMQKGYRSLQSLDRSDYLILKFEDLLTEFDSTCSEICQFLEIGYQPDMAEFYKQVEAKDGKVNFGKPIIRSNTQKWKSQLSASDIKRIEEIAYNTLELFDYPISSAKTAKPISMLERGRGFIHDCFALIFVGNNALKNNKLSYKLKAAYIALRKRFDYWKNCGAVE